MRSSPKLISALKLAGFVNATVLSKQELDVGRNEVVTRAMTDTIVTFKPEDLKNVVITEVSVVGIDHRCGVWLYYMVIMLDSFLELHDSNSKWCCR